MYCTVLYCLRVPVLAYARVCDDDRRLSHRRLLVAALCRWVQSSCSGSGGSGAISPAHPPPPPRLLVLRLVVVVVMVAVAAAAVVVVMVAMVAMGVWVGCERQQRWNNSIIFHLYAITDCYTTSCGGWVGLLMVSLASIIWLPLLHACASTQSRRRASILQLISSMRSAHQQHEVDVLLHLAAALTRPLSRHPGHLSKTCACRSMAVCLSARAAPS